ncbi:MAG TPA: hypothetical protein VF074_03015 [Pyrinomonadaceae bacterium]
MKILSIIILLLVLVGQSFSGNVTAAEEDSTICAVHKEKMIKGTVPAHFGRIAMWEFDAREEPERDQLVSEYRQEKKEHFPETYRWVNGGCDPMFWLGKTSVTLHYCETCRRLEEEWLAKHPHFLKIDRLP